MSTQPVTARPEPFRPPEVLDRLADGIARVLNGAADRCRREGLSLPPGEDARPGTSP